MSASQKHQYLGFSVKILNLLCLWPPEGRPHISKWREFRTYWIFFSTSFTWIPILAEIYFTFNEDDVGAITQIQVLLSNTCIWGMFYMAICFINNREKVKDLVRRIENFEQYMGANTIIVDKKVTFFSKCFLIYSLFGLLVYVVGPWMDLSYCEEHKYASMDTRGVPCTIIIPSRLPFRYDVSPYFEIYFLHQAYVGLTTVVVVVTLTMMICGILIHVINQLQNLKRHVLELCSHSEDKMDEAVRYVVKYHTFIIEYFEEVNNAFGSVMVLHITLTSFVISVLCFEIVLMSTAGHFIPSIRYVLHLLGWLVILFLLCYYGQKVIDESTDVSIVVYDTPWYNSPIRIQKDFLLILIRSQKPLSLKAMKFGTMSAETFLSVLRAAYSYFALLIQTM